MAKYLSNIDLNKNELQNPVIHPLGTAPSSPNEGQIYFDSTTGDKHIYLYNGSAWVQLSEGADSNDFLTGLSFNTGDGVLTATVQNQSNVTVDLDGRYALSGDIPTVNNPTITLSAGTYLGGGGDFSLNQSGAETITFNHDNTSRTDTTSTDSGNTFTVVDSVTTNATGHVTAINVKTQTVSDDDTTSLPIKNSGGTTQFTSTDVTGLRFEGGTNVTVGFTSADQTVTINSTDQYQGTVTGTGTTNTLPKWTNGGSGVLGNSSITDDGTTVTIAGNLDVEGTTTTIDSTTVAIGDNMMKYAKDNTANASDIGWYGKIVSSGTKYPGMWYDASTGVSTPKFALGIATTEPAATGTIATTGTLVADLEGNADTASRLETSRNFSITGDITASAVSFNGSANVELNASIDSNVVGATELNVSGNGTNGQVLASDGDGSFSWVDQTATAPVDDVTASTANDELGISISPTTGNVVVGIDINGMDASLGQDAAVNDLLIIYDNSASQNKKVRLDNLLELIGVNRSKRIDLNSTVSGVTRAEAGGVTTFTINVETIFGSGAIAQNVMCEVIGNAENEGDTVYADIGRGPETGSGYDEMTVAFVGSVANGDYQVLLNRIGEMVAV